MLNGDGFQLPVANGVLLERAIRNLQDSVLPKLKTQLAEWERQVKEKHRPPMLDSAEG